jgi:hypothetical protein
MQDAKVRYGGMEVKREQDRPKEAKAKLTSQRKAERD